MTGNKRKKPTYLPHEIIENILTRLPVKSLLRFKSVCRQWNATISDPKFAQTHLQISKNSSSLSLSCLLVKQEISSKTAQLVSFENGSSRRLSAIHYPRLHRRLLSHCDGLYFITYSTVRRRHAYALWNPSRRSCKKLNKHRFESHTLISGICYDPLLNDYKVVMGDAKRYVVFYCRRNHWSDLKEMNRGFKIRNHHRIGASLMGSVYWVCYSRERKDTEIVYFDGRDETWKNLWKLGMDERGAQSVELISSREGLYLFNYCKTWRGPNIESLFLKKFGDEWMELKVKVRTPLPRLVPMTVYDGGLLRSMFCSVGNKIIVCYPNKKYVVICDVSEKSLAIVECPRNLGVGCGRLLPYQENMFCD